MKLPGYMKERRVINGDGTMSIYLDILKWHPGFWLLCLGILCAALWSAIRGKK